MPDDKTRDPGSITKTADNQNERISGISNVSQTITQMQKSTQRQIDETRESIDYGASPDMTAKEMNGVLSRFGKTITAFTRGIENVTMSSARATKDAIGEYGKAISQDINYNKQNVVAMALSRTTPLFGYFAAKFMETDVYKKAKERMSASISGVFKSVGSSIANIFRGKEKAHSDAVPKMQRGGYVEKGGMVEVHPAEVIMPIEKILARIDDSISLAKEITDITQKTQIRSLAKMSTFVEAERSKEPVGMTKGFFRALREVHSQYEEPSNVRMLRAVLSIQDTLGSTIGTWEQVWTKMLVEHPTFRQLAFGMRTIGKVFTSPFKILSILFKQRGGYRSHLSRSKNPFEQMSQNMAQLYVDSMHRLDNISYYTKATAVILRDMAGFISQGRLKYSGNLFGIADGSRSLIGWARLGLNWMTKWMPAVLAGGFDLMLGGTGKGGWQKGKALGEALTNPIEWAEKIQFWKKFDRSAKLETAYGAGDFFSLIQDQQKGKAPPIVVTPSQKLIEYQEESMDLLETVGQWGRATAKELDKHNDRERRKGLMGFFGMIGGGIWNLLKGAGGFLTNLLGLGKGGWLWNSVTGLFSATGPILSSVLSLFGKTGPILSALSSPWFWGPIGAGLLGAGIGMAIDKWAIQPLVEHWGKKWQKSNIEATKAENKGMSESVKAARGETATGMGAYHGRVEAAARASLTSEERSKDLSGFLIGGPDKRIMEIQKGQMDFVKENIGAYSQYDPNKLKKYRSEWLKGEGGTAFGMGRFFWQDPVKYGMRREAAFLNWLQRKGEVVNAQSMMESHEAQIYASKNIAGDAEYFVRKYGEKARDWIAEKGKFAVTKGGQIVDKATGKIIDAKELAKMEASDLMASAKLVSQELKERGMEGLEGMKDMGDKVAGQLNQVQTVIHQQMSKVTSIYNSGANKAGELYDDMKQRVVTGNFH